jgi:ADP-ribose pyrophosphatase YjhB (NUDIX family)
MTNYSPIAAPPRFCPHCGGPLSERLLETEDRPRLVCDRCQHILYLDPKVVVGVIVERRGRILLLRRAIEPRYGTWTFPSGYMEVDETAEEAGQREVEEEAGLRVKPGPLLGVYSRPAPAGPGVLVVVFRSRRLTGRLCIGREVLEARWFHPDDIPWGELSFQTTHWALRDWLRCRDAQGARFRPPRRGA